MHVLSTGPPSLSKALLSFGENNFELHRVMNHETVTFPYAFIGCCVPE